MRTALRIQRKARWWACSGSIRLKTRLKKILYMMVLTKRGTPFPVSPSGLLVAGRGQVFRVFLERTDSHVAVVEGVDALDGCGERLDRRQAGHRPRHGRRTDLVAVEAAAGAVRGVDDEVD